MKQSNTKHGVRLGVSHFSFSFLISHAAGFFAMFSADLSSANRDPEFGMLLEVLKIQTGVGCVYTKKYVLILKSIKGGGKR